jgi:hypothetical protein
LHANAEPLCATSVDKKIEHYRQPAARVRDPLLTEGVDKLIEKMEAEKTAFHPEQPK